MLLLTTHQRVLYLAGPVHILVGEVLEGLLLGVLPRLCCKPTNGRLQVLLCTYIHTMSCIYIHVHIGGMYVTVGTLHSLLYVHEHACTCTDIHVILIYEVTHTCSCNACLGFATHLLEVNKGLIHAYTTCTSYEFANSQNLICGFTGC